MSDLNQKMAAKYQNNFLKEIEEQAEMGDWVKMCMQCGLCSGSCPTHFQAGWDHPPQEIFRKPGSDHGIEATESPKPSVCLWSILKTQLPISRPA